MAGTADPAVKTHRDTQVGLILQLYYGIFLTESQLQFLTALPGTESLHDDVSQGRE